LTKTPLIYSVSRFNLVGLGALFGGISPPKPPMATGLGVWWIYFYFCTFSTNYCPCKTKAVL